MAIAQADIVLVEEKHLTAAVQRLVDHIQSRLDKYGPRAFVSRHEGFGIIMEEVFEMSNAIRDNTTTAYPDEVQDVATSCVWMIASMLATTDAFTPVVEAPVPEDEHVGVGLN